MLYIQNNALESKNRYPFTYADAEEKSGITSNLLRSLYEVSVCFIWIASQSTQCCRNTSSVLQMFGQYYITQFWGDRHSTRRFLRLRSLRYFKSIQYARRNGYIRFKFEMIEHAIVKDNKVALQSRDTVVVPQINSSATGANGVS